MSTAFSLPAPGLKPFDLISANAQSKMQLSAAGQLSEAGKAKAKAAAQSFEAVFLNSMFEHMYTGIGGDGPFGGGGATGIWRSFLTDEYAKTFAKAGGIGIADKVYKTLIAQQEIQK